MRFGRGTYLTEVGSSSSTRRTCVCEMLNASATWRVLSPREIARGINLFLCFATMRSAISAAIAASSKRHPALWMALISSDRRLSVALMPHAR